MPAGRFRPIANQKPAVAAPKLGPAAGGGAVLRRQTFQPENRKQQAGLHADVAAEANRLEQVHQRQAAQSQARKLYAQGKRAQAIKLAQTSGLGIASPGRIGKYVERTGSDIGQAAYYTPAGLVATGSAAVAAARGNPKPIEKLGKGIVKQTVESFTHPGRHPGYTLLNVLAAASAGAGAVSRVGAAGEALRSGEGIGAAIARPGFKGGSLLHKKAPGEINLPGGAQALEYDNPLLRPIQRARLKRATRDIQTGREPVIGSKHLAAQNVVGRELRAREQVQADIAQAPIEAARARAKALNPNERTAMRLIATEGRHALANPEETVARQAAVHRAWAEQGIDPKLNQEVAKDIEASLPVLQAREPKFMQAVAAVRRVSKRSERELVGGERLSQEAADARRAKIAQAYGHPSTTLTEDQARAAVYRVESHAGRTYGRGATYKTSDEAVAAAERIWTALGKPTAGPPEVQFTSNVKTSGHYLSHDGAEHPVIQLGHGMRDELTLTHELAHTVTRIATRSLEHPKGHTGHGEEFVGPYLKALQKSFPKHAKTIGAQLERGAKPPKGSFYFPTGERFKFPTRPLKGGAVSRRPSQYGLGPVDSSRYLQGTTKQFTGKGLRRGVVQRPGEAIASRATGTAKLASAERVHGSLLKLATPEPRSQYDIPIRATRQVSSADRRKVAAALEEAQTGDKTALVRAQNTLKDALRPGEGEKAVYVDQRYLKQIAGGTGSVLAQAGAKFNKPFRFFGVYARPAYIATNRPQNFLMRHLEQGIRTKKPVRGTVGRMRRQLGPELSAKIDASSGTTRTESYVPRGLGGRLERAVTEKVSGATDTNERFLAVLARAHQKGYRTERDLRRLYADQAPEKVVNDRIAISRRASKDMVDFRSVTPGEHELADLIYFYPWLSRGSAWAARFVAQHPIKSAALASVAPAGQQAQRKALGPVPGWMKGFIPTSRGVINPASVNTFETPAQIGQTFAHPTGPQTRAFGEEFGTPILQALTTSPNQLGKRAIQSLAPGLLAQRLGLIGKPPKTFPQTGIGPALGPFALGGLYPRKADLAQVHSQGLKELPPEQRVKIKAQDFKTAALQAWKKAGVLQDPQATTQALDSSLRLYTKRYAAYGKAGIKTGSANYQQDAFKVDVNLLASMGKLDSTQKSAALAWAKTATDSKISAERAKIAEAYFGSKLINAAASDLKKRGVKVTLPR